jgi:minichromosome maintenance protein 10
MQRQENQEPRTVLGNLEDSIDDDDDEETLQLQLQEIQARLKLKKLQKEKAKAKWNVGLDAETTITHGRNDLLARANSAADRSRPRRDASKIQERGIERSKPEASIHVPVSPIRRVQSTDTPRSPGRVLLGIDKGLKGADVSLRRAPSLRKASEGNVDMKRAGGYLQRTSSQASSYGSISVKQSQSSTEGTKLRTFSERMADIRSQETDRMEKDALLKRVRSKAFNINEREMEEYKVAAATLPEVAMPAPHFSRDQVIDACSEPSSGLLQRSKSTSNLPSTRISDSRTTSTTSAIGSTLRPSSRLQKQPPSEKSLQEPSEFESFSSLHLSKRIIPHTILTRTLAGKKTYNVPDLLKVVVSPFYRLPDIEEDIVVLAIIASKSEPKQHKAKIGNEERGKYMVMTLTDLKWELDLFLFNSGFDRFWKLTPGTVIAILNPNVMPPMQTHSGRFSLALNSSDDTVLEIGSARDLGFCKSVKKDGKTCDSWVDKRHTEYCEFHVNELLKKTTAGRMEVNTMDFGKRGGTGNFGGRRYNSKDMTGYEKPKKNAPRYDVGTHSKLFIGASIRSSADLLDDTDVDPDAFHRGMNKEERMRRQLAAAEKEREIARKLSSIGGGLGADYLRMKNQPDPALSKTVDKPPDPPDAAALGLLGSKAKEVNLSPIKRKRGGMSSQSSSTSLGWGGDLTKELGRMEEGERLQPVRKKTRFVTAKGIREAGRESFGGDVALSAPANNVDDDDEDDLDIIR